MPCCWSLNIFIYEFVSVSVLEYVVVILSGLRALLIEFRRRIHKVIILFSVKILAENGSLQITNGMFITLITNSEYFCSLATRY